jgi:protein-S-isoprenylcysteine O-methyltransferase Ste14
MVVVAAAVSVASERPMRQMAATAAQALTWLVALLGLAGVVAAVAVRNQTRSCPGLLALLVSTAAVAVLVVTPTELLFRARAALRALSG